MLERCRSVDFARHIDAWELHSCRAVDFAIPTDAWELQSFRLCNTHCASGYEASAWLWKAYSLSRFLIALEFAMHTLNYDSVALEVQGLSFFTGWLWLCRSHCALRESWNYPVLWIVPQIQLPEESLLDICQFKFQGDNKNIRIRFDWTCSNYNFVFSPQVHSP